MGARLRWASATIWTIRDSMVSEPTLSARITIPPVPLIVPPITVAPGPSRPASIAGHHRFVDGALTLQHDAVDRHGVAGADPQSISHLHLVERDLLVVAGLADASGGFGARFKRARMALRFARGHATPGSARAGRGR